MRRLGLKPISSIELQKFRGSSCRRRSSAQPAIQGLGERTGRRRQVAPARSVVSRRACRISATVPLMQGSVETEDAWNDPPPPLEMPEARDARRASSASRATTKRRRESWWRCIAKRIRASRNTDVWLIMNADNTRRANAQTARRAEVCAGQGAGVSVLLQLAIAGAQGTDEVVPHARHSVRAVQHRSSRRR